MSQSVELLKAQYTIIGFYGESEQMFSFHVYAASPGNAFYQVAKDHDQSILVAALKGHHFDGNSIEFAGSALVDAETVISQPEVFELQVESPKKPVTDLKPILSTVIQAYNQHLISTAMLQPFVSIGCPTPTDAIQDAVRVWIGRQIDLANEKSSNRSSKEISIRDLPDLYNQFQFPSDLDPSSLETIEQACAEALKLVDQTELEEALVRTENGIEDKGVYESACELGEYFGLVDRKEPSSIDLRRSKDQVVLRAESEENRWDRKMQLKAIAPHIKAFEVESGSKGVADMFNLLIERHNHDAVLDETPSPIAIEGSEIGIRVHRAHINVFMPVGHFEALYQFIKNYLPSDRFLCRIRPISRGM